MKPLAFYHKFGGVAKLEGNQMLRESGVLEHYRQVKEALHKLEQDREDYLEMLQADEKWLKRRGINVDEDTDGSGYGEGRIGPPNDSTFAFDGSNSDLFVEILRRSAREMHASEIWGSAEHLGARTDSPDPVKNADATLRQIAARPSSPIVSLGGRRYVHKLHHLDI